MTSDRIKGYDVYVDGVFYSSDIADDVLDGTANLRVGGDGIHTITISKGGPLARRSTVANTPRAFRAVTTIYLRYKCITLNS